MSEISIFAHHAMTTKWEIRIAGEDPTYAAQAAMAAFEWADRIEGLLSRFREESELSVIARLAPGGRFRLSELTFACLSLARECEVATGAAFSLGATAVRLGQARPAWRLNAASRELVVERAPCLLDAGAIGKGFALDRMAEELTEWSVASFLLVSGGSSVLAGEAPPGAPGWKVGVGEEPGGNEFYLVRAGFGASGFSVKGDHITDPHTGLPANRYARTWALAPSAALADALSTAWMSMDEKEVACLCVGDRFPRICNFSEPATSDARPFPEPGYDHAEGSLGAALLDADGSITLIGGMRGLPIVMV